MSVGSPTDERSTDLEQKPALVSSVVSLLAGLFALLMSAPSVALALPFGLLGVLFLAVGLLYAGSRRWVSLGVTSLFVGILIVGAMGAVPSLTLLLSAVSLLVAWDVGMHAITVGEQFGREAPTRRGELVHSASSFLVGILATGVAYGLSRVVSGGRPAITIVVLVIGAVSLVWALRE